MVLANARLSEKRWPQARALARPVAAGLSRSLAAVLAQTEADAAAPARRPARPSKGVFGNLKFDVAPDAALLERGRRWRAAPARPVVMFASSREGEEADCFRV